MTYDIGDIMLMVRAAMDCNEINDPLISDKDPNTLSLDSIIRRRITEAARVVESKAPSHLIDGGRAFAGTVGWPDGIGTGMGKIHLPDDFMRLICFQMSDWECPVTTAISENDPEYAMQSSRFPGLRGTPQKPVVAITQQPVGLVLEFYSCKSGEDVKVLRARYLPIPSIKNNGIELCEKLVPSIVNYAASLTALTIGEYKQAESLQNISNELMMS